MQQGVVPRPQPGVPWCALRSHLYEYAVSGFTIAEDLIVAWVAYYIGN